VAVAQTSAWAVQLAECAVHKVTLRDLVEGAGALPVGHALDVGCGSGINAIYLARHGWRVTAVDFSAAAIASARRAARGVTGATFLEGDVTKLSQLPIEQPIDLVLDMGCYHSLPDGAKSTYVAELAAVIADALSATGHLDTAYRLVLQRERPSWLSAVAMDGTTIWER
jgi:SAM-dependent methyltransferase